LGGSSRKRGSGTRGQASSSEKRRVPDVHCARAEIVVHAKRSGAQGKARHGTHRARPARDWSAVRRIEESPARLRL